MWAHSRHKHEPSLSEPTGHQIVDVAEPDDFALATVLWLDIN